jgi:hypothetical protein
VGQFSEIEELLFRKSWRETQIVLSLKRYTLFLCLSSIKPQIKIKKKPYFLKKKKKNKKIKKKKKKKKKKKNL